MGEQPAILSESEFLVAYLRDHDVACPGCHYNLRNLLTTRCPECGEELQLRLNLVEQKQKALIAGVVGLSAGLGFNLLLLLYWIVTLVRGRLASSGDSKITLTLAIGSLLFSGLLLFWLRYWSRIRSFSKSTRLCLAIAAWGATLCGVLIFSLIVPQ